MITKGKATTGRGLAAHLLKAENERVELWGISGTVARTVNAAVDNWRAFALGTTCDKPLYHAQLNPSPDDRPLSREEWEKAIGIFEKEMGLEGYPRAVVFHEKKGREHIHLVYSRFNPELEQEKLKAWSDSWNYPKHERASREIERELGLRKTKGVFVEREGPRPERTPTHDAMQQGERTQRDPKEIKAEVSALYAARANNGPAFVQALEAAGYTLARGDKRGFVILDQAGGVHSLTRAASAKAGDLGKTLHEYRLDDLPSVEQAREISKTRQPISPAAALEKAKAEITDPPKEKEAAPKTDRAPEARAIEPERHTSPAPQTDTRSDGSLKSAEAGLTRGIDALGGGIANVLEAASDALENAVLGLLDPTPPPPPPSREQIAAREAAKDEAEARAADLKRYLTDQDYRRQLWRQEMEAQEEQRKQGDKAKEQDNSQGRERSRF